VSLVVVGDLSKVIVRELDFVDHATAADGRTSLYFLTPALDTDHPGICTDSCGFARLVRP
jgi:hypothetical protein